MRKLMLAAAVVAVMAMPAMAQRRPGGGGGMGQMLSGDALLLNKSVQKELKFTDDQTKEATEISKKLGEAMREAFGGGDRDKAREAMTKAREESTKGTKKLREGLTSEQAKRFSQIDMQQAVKNHDLKSFQSETAIKTLSLTEKQQTAVKEALDTLAKDRKELMDDAGTDRNKTREAMKKIGTMRTEAYEKFAKDLTDDQQKALKDAQGEKFEIKIETPGGGGAGGGRRPMRDAAPKKDEAPKKDAAPKKDDV